MMHGPTNIKIVQYIRRTEVLTLRIQQNKLPSPWLYAGALHSPSVPLLSALDSQLRSSVQGPSIEMNRPALSSDELPWNARNASFVLQICGASH